MALQSFHGAGHAGAIGPSYPEQHAPPALYEVDAAQNGVLRETLREFVADRDRRAGPLKPS